MENLCKNKACHWSDTVALSVQYHWGRGDEPHRMGGAIATTCHSTKHVTRETYYLAKQKHTERCRNGAEDERFTMATRQGDKRASQLGSGDVRDLEMKYFILLINIDKPCCSL